MSTFNWRQSGISIFFFHLEMALVWAKTLLFQFCNPYIKMNFSKIKLVFASLCF